jgi:CelD/BcsL family acetyltransferase involved in cellulose biosynthesis
MTNTTTSGAAGRAGSAAPSRVVSTRIVPLDDLGSAERDAWLRLRATNPSLDSPYFHPGFAEAVHASGAQVRVVVGRDTVGDVCALLPCHRDRKVLRPVGWPGADFQGPILAPGTTCPPLTLLSGGVRAFAFDHLLDGYAEFAPWVDGGRPSPYIDTSGGLAGYLGRASRSGKDNMNQARRRLAKAERTYGPVRFAADVVDDQALAQVVTLKRAQYKATGANDYFADPSRVDLLTRLLHTRDAEFGGVLSTLHVGPNLVAAHFGMRADNVLHWWFPVYDPEFAALAPGWLLLRELVEASPAIGITRLDLGRGEDEYKRRAKTGETTVNHGMVTRNSARRALRRTRASVVDATKSSPLGPALRRVVRKLRNS